MANTTRDYAYKLGLGIIGIALIGGLVALLFSVEGMLSFEVAFLGFLSVVGGSFLGVFKRLKAQEQDTQHLDSKDLKQSVDSKQNLDLQSLDATQNIAQDSQSEESKDCIESKDSQTPQTQAKQENSSFSARFVLGTQISFSLLRMLSYIVFAGFILLLLHYKLFTLMWFFVGLCVAFVVLVGLGMFMIKAYEYTKM